MLTRNPSYILARNRLNNVHRKPRIAKAVTLKMFL